MVAIRNSQSNHCSDQESGAQSERVIISEEIVQRVRKTHPGYIKGRGKIITGSSSSGDGQNKNVELVKDLQRQVDTSKRELQQYKSFMQSYMQELTA